MSEQFVGTRAVAPPHDFDRARLAAWMCAHVDGFRGDIEVEQFKGGQSNPTYRVSAGGRRYVMRRKPPGSLLPSAHAVEREYRVITALAATDVPVARGHALCEDPSVIGTAFYLMDYVEGRIFWDPKLPGMTAPERGAIFAEMNRVIATLHCVAPAAVGLADYGRTASYLARQVARWTKQYRAAETERIEAVERLIAWLPENIPPGESLGIVHGDYRLDNVIFDPVEPRILAVLDWELSTLGHTLADFAYHAMTWRMEPERGLDGADLAGLGIPSEAAYVASYCRRTGRAAIGRREWEYCMVFNMFRLVGILQGIAARALLGNASSPQASAMGRRARPLAERAWAFVEAMPA